MLVKDLHCAFTHKFPHDSCIDFLSQRAMETRIVVFEVLFLSALPLWQNQSQLGLCISYISQICQYFCQLLRRREGKYRNPPAVFKLLVVICIAGSAIRRLINLIHWATQVPFILIRKGIFRKKYVFGRHINHYPRIREYMRDKWVDS